MAHALADLIRRRGGEVRLSARCLRLVPEAGGWTAVTTAGDFRGCFVVTCGGLHADRLVRASGLKPSARIVPFRGEYYELTPSRRSLVRNLIYPVPDPEFPFWASISHAKSMVASKGISDQESAARRYNQAAKLVHGMYAKLNDVG